MISSCEIMAKSSNDEQLFPLHINKVIHISIRNANLEGELMP